MLNQQVKRNPDRFPEDFSFILSKAEWEAVVALRSQIVTLKRGQHRKYLPRVFTEHGALMAANVLNSKRAVEMSVYVVRAFIKMRSALSETRVLARKLASLEREVKSRLDSHDAAIVEVMQRILDLIDPPGTCRPATPTPAQDRLQRKTACRASIEPASPLPLPTAPLPLASLASWRFKTSSCLPEFLIFKTSRSISIANESARSSRQSQIKNYKSKNPLASLATWRFKTSSLIS